LSPKPKRKRSTIKRSRTSKSKSKSRTRSKSRSGTSSKTGDNMREKVKDDILQEIKAEVYQELTTKNDQLESEIADLRKQLSQLGDLQKPQQVQSVHNEWPKLNMKDRATLRLKLAKEIKTHHNNRQKKVFKLERNLKKKEEKLQKYKKEINKLEHQLKKHGVKYVGPPEEDQLWRLFLCQKYRSDRLDIDSSKEVFKEYQKSYEKRFSIAHNAVKLEERQVQRKWAELFTDLIFVAIIVKFASQINSQYIYYCKLGNVTQMVYTLINGLLFFLPFWCLWLELTVTLIRFHDFEGKWYGLVDDTLIFIVLAGVIEISFQIDINADLFETQYANRFLLGFGLCVIALLLLHIFYRWKLFPSKRYTTRRIWSYSLALAVLFLTLIQPDHPMWIIISVEVSSLIMLYVTLVSFRVHPLAGNTNDEHVHNHQYQIFCLEAVVERFGIFSMIVIGESILALLIAPDPQSFIRYICVYFAFGLLFTFQLMYFGSHAEEGCHALHKIGFPGSVFWIFIHLPLSTSLLCVGIGLRLLVTFADLDYVPPQISIVLVIGTTVTIVNYYILRQCHDKFKLTVPSVLRLLPVIICPCCLFLTLDSFGVILWCFIITVCSWFFDIILISEYETKPIWMTHQQSHAEFNFHPEEYNPVYLPYDSFLFCRNYDGEHGRTIIVSLAEYIIDDQMLHDHEAMMGGMFGYDDEDDDDEAEIDGFAARGGGLTDDDIDRALAPAFRKERKQSNGDHKKVTPPNGTPMGVKIARNQQLQSTLPKSPKVYIDQISNKIEASTRFLRRNSASRSKSSKHRDKQDDGENDDNDDADSTKLPEPTQNATHNVPGAHPKIMLGPNGETLPPPQTTAGSISPYTPLAKPIHVTHDKNSDGVESDDSDPSTNNKTNIPHHNKGSGNHSATQPPPSVSPGGPLAPLTPPASKPGHGKARKNLKLEANVTDSAVSTQVIEALDPPPNDTSRSHGSSSNVVRSVSGRSIAGKTAITDTALKQYTKHHQTRPTRAESNKLGIKRDETHSIKLRSPALDGLGMQQVQTTSSNNLVVDDDEYEESVPTASMTGTATATATNNNTLGSSLHNLPLHPFKMTKSRSHEKAGEDAVDFDSWVHEFEEDHEETHEHRHQWFSEFADLVFVAIIINFADQIKNISVNMCVHHSTANFIELDCLTVLVMEAALFFLGFFTVWYELSVTIIRFSEIEGIFDDVLKFMYLGGIVTMTLQMDKYAFLSDNIGGFTMGIIVCLLCITLLHIVYYFNVENCQLYAKKRIILYCVSIIILLLVSVINDTYLSFIAIAIVSIMILWISSNSFRVILTPNDEMLELPEDVFEKIVERWGIFVMIATGESILALIATTNKIIDVDAVSKHEKDTDIAFQHYIAILCAFGITYLVSHYYLESSKINSMHFHALMHPGSPGSVMWTLLHGILGFFLMMVGAGWKLVLLSLSLEICWLDAEDYYEYGTQEAADYASDLKHKCCDKYHLLGDCDEYHGDGWIEFSVLLGASLMASLICMYLIRTSHPKFIFSWKSVLCRFPIIVMIPVGAYWTNSFQTQSFYYCVWCLILMTISYFVDHLFIDIYQTDIKPELRVFYNTQLEPVKRQQSLHNVLDHSKRKSVEFSRSHSVSRGNSLHHMNSLHRQRSASKSKSKSHTHTHTHGHH